MECDALGPDLSAYADGEVEIAARRRVETHLASCPACRRSLETWRAAGEILRREDATPAPRLPSLEALRARPRAILRRARRWLVPTAAALAAAAFLSFDRVRAAREAGLVVTLEGRNRAETARLLADVESLRYEIASLAFRARAAGEGEAAAVVSDLRPLVEALKRLEGQVVRIQTELDREGLLGDEEERKDDPRTR